MTHGAQHGSDSLRAMEFYKVHFFNGTVHLDTLFYSWGIILLLVVLSFVARRKFGVIPSRIQALFEIIYDWIRGMAEDMIGHDGKKYAPFIMTIFLFVLLSNWLGLVPSFIPPSRDINTTLGLAIISFLSFTYFGIREKGFLGWLGHFFQPAPGLWNALEGPMKYIIGTFLFVLFFVLNIIEELARVVSLSVRLMGNIMGEHLAIAIFLSIVLMGGQLTVITASTKLMVWASSAFVMIIGALTGFIQAMIFSVLTISYIAGAVSEEH